jgi:motility quorum-sensing regulator/GCU-specific mRNA interferase toxin
MEKRKPTYDLESFKADFAAHSVEITLSARRDALELGFDRDGMTQVIATMERLQFVKSMTSYDNNRVWQDVYNVPFEELVLYVKITNGTVTAFRLLSFKER